MDKEAPSAEWRARLAAGPWYCVNTVALGLAPE